MGNNENTIIIKRDSKKDAETYKVVVNHEEQYSIWPVDRAKPNGWKNEGKSGTKEECLAHIKKVWTDMRPLSLRKHMEQSEENHLQSKKKVTKQKENIQENAKDPRDNLVKFLSEGKHPLEVYLGPERRVKFFKEAIDRGYINIKFTDTRGETTLGFRLDPNITDLSQANFVKESGIAHIGGTLTLNYTEILCIADVDLKTLTGQGCFKLIHV